MQVSIDPLEASVDRMLTNHLVDRCDRRQPSIPDGLRVVAPKPFDELGHARRQTVRAQPRASRVGCGLAAIATIDEVVREHAIDAGFEWVDGYLHAPLNGETDEESNVCRRTRLARELGFDAEYVDAVPLVNQPGIRFADQARIHPRRYLAGVAKAFVARGGRIYEHSAAEEFCDAPRAVKVGGHTVQCEDVVIATHNPLVGLAGMAGATLFQTKLALYTSYVIAGRAPSGAVPTPSGGTRSDPYYFLRVDPHRDFDVVIFGGEDHKTGQQDDTADCYRRLEERLTALVPRRRAHASLVGPGDRDARWPAVHRAKRRTSVRGNRLCRQRPDVRDVGRHHDVRRDPGPFESMAELFDPGRKALTRGLWDYLKENVDYPYYLIRDRFAGADARSLRAVKRGKGKIIERNGAKVAAYRDRPGGDPPLRDLHSYGLYRRLEQCRTDVGLPLPRVAVQAERRGDLGARRNAALPGRMTRWCDGGCSDPESWRTSIIVGGWRGRGSTSGADSEMRYKRALGRSLAVDPALPYLVATTGSLPVRPARHQCRDRGRRDDRRLDRARIRVRRHRHDPTGSRTVGRGSTAASSALLLQEPDLELTELTNATHRASRRIWQVSRESVHALVRLLRRLKIACDVTVRDAIYYATDGAAVARLRRSMSCA